MSVLLALDCDLLYRENISPLRVWSLLWCMKTNGIFVNHFGTAFRF